MSNVYNYVSCMHITIVPLVLSLMCVHIVRNSVWGICEYVSVLVIVLLQMLWYLVCVVAVLGYLITGSVIASEAISIALSVIYCIPCSSVNLICSYFILHVVGAVIVLVIIIYHIVCVHSSVHGVLYGYYSDVDRWYNVSMVIVCDVCVFSVISGVLFISVIGYESNVNSEYALPLSWIMGVYSSVALMSTSGFVGVMCGMCGVWGLSLIVCCI